MDRQQEQEQEEQRPQDQEQEQGQEIVTECSPTYCACDPNLPRCMHGFEQNRLAAWRDDARDFHLYRVQQRVEASVQPSHEEGATSMLRRRAMANRLMTQQDPAASMLFRRRPNSSAFLRRHSSTLDAQPFGRLVPEQAPACSLQRLAAPQGQDQWPKDQDLTCDQFGACISGDTNSDDSLEQSRKRQQ